MQIDDYVIETAVLRIFRDYRVFHPGGRLFLDTLRDVWDQSGLRRNDLVTGIRLLEEQGSVRQLVDPAYEQILIALEANGAERLNRFPRTFDGWLRDIHTTLVLRKAARRYGQSEFWRRVRAHLHRDEWDQAALLR